MKLIIIAALLTITPVVPTRETEVVEINGNVATMADGTETADWFIIDGNEVVM